MKTKLPLLPVLFGGLLLLGEMSMPAAEPARVDVILWFDTEDYLLPASDDAVLRLAMMLTERNIHATFKVVGERARVLERRGRQDVIAALKQHCLAYHANFHSVHPTPSEYLADCDLLDGMAEFIRREGGGADDVRRVFNVPTLACYGQPGSSWAPQTITALKAIGVAPHGVPCYVDEGDHVGLNEKPFWYGGALTVYHMGENCTRMDLHDPAAVKPAQQRVSAVAERLREAGGGLISIYYHPCEWVHRQFWDGVNFSRGANPPREQWKIPPQRTAAETDGAFQRFGEYIDYIRTLPNLRFVTASDLPLIYPDTVRSVGATEDDLKQIAARLAAASTDGIGMQVIGIRAYSLADQFELLGVAVGKLIEGKTLEYPRPAKGLLGPDHPPPSTSKIKQLDWPAFRDAALDVRNFIGAEHRIPARVFVGAEAFPPADFLTGLAAVYHYYCQEGKLPEQTGVTLRQGLEVLPARHVAKDTPGLFGGWVIHREGFRAPKILEVARLQAWTLKPAIRNE